MKKVIAALISIAAIAFPQVAIAQYNAPHKYTDTATGKTKIYFPGVANTKLAYISSASRNSTVYYDRCGWAHISLGSSVPVSVSSTQLSILPLVSTTALYSPVCTPEMPAGSWFTREPDVNGVWNVVSVSVASSGLSPTGYSYYNPNLSQLYIKLGVSSVAAAGFAPINIIYNRSFSANINPCGFGTITVSSTRPMTTFKIGTTDYTLATLPEVTKPQICRTVAGSKIKYVPLQ